jgi:lysophospholipase L1-like esterase
VTGGSETHARRAASRLRGLALGAFAALLPFAILEFVLAAADFQYTPPLLVPLWGGQNDVRMLVGEGIYRPHPYWFWELRPGALIDPASGERVSAAGTRGPDPATSPTDRLRLAALGDSSTFGLGVDGEETFSRRLTALAPVEVINFGVPGYTAFQGAKLYPKRVRPLRPDIVVLAYGAVNENSARDPDAAERYRVTSRTSPAAIAVSNALLRFRSYQLLRFAIAKLRDEEDAAGEARRRFFENLERREKGMNYKRNVDVPAFREALRELIRAAREDGARVLLVSPPRTPRAELERPELLEYTRAIFEVGRETRAPVCDVRRGFRERRDPTLLRDSVHPGGRGHRLYAELLRDCLAREEILPGSGDAS